MNKPRLLGFYYGKVIVGDHLPRGCGGPEDQQNPHRVRWCPQCKAVWEWHTHWNQGKGWDARACAVCQHRQGFPTAYAHIAQLAQGLFGTSPLTEPASHVVGVPWSQFLAEFASLSDWSADRFLTGSLQDLRDFWNHLASEWKRTKGAA